MPSLLQCVIVMIVIVVDRESIMVPVDLNYVVCLCSVGTIK